MQYIVKEKFNIFDIAPSVGSGYSVVVAEPERYLAKMYEKHLKNSGYEVNLIDAPHDIYPFLRKTPAHAVLLNVDMYEHSKAAHEHIAYIVEHFPSLVIVTLGFDTSGEDLKKYMSVGIGSHMNRKMSKPSDVVHVLKTLLK